MLPGMDPGMEAVWTSARWRAEVEAWIRAVLDDAGLEPDGPIEQQRVRPWSTLLTVPTSGGLLWFKENTPAQRAEAAVVQELARLAPDHVIVPLAVEPGRGWLLTHDHAPTLRGAGDSDERIWARVLEEYADLQRRVAGAEAALAAAGLESLPPERVAEILEDRVRRLRALGPEDIAHVPAELAERSLEALPRLVRLSERLEQTGPRLRSLDHNDLHTNNAFLPRPDEDTLRFFDFGDALWAHPFTSLGIPIGVMSRDWECDPDDPRIEGVIDRYLERWTDAADLAELRETARLARLLYPLHRFECWRRVLQGLPASRYSELEEPVQYWLGVVADTPAV